MEYSVPDSAKKGDFFARIFDITMNIIISGDTNDHRGMRIQEKEEKEGEEEERRRRGGDTDRGEKPG